ncbi:SafA/ExsA family spore coat assembly protein [Bacillus methanolicus]|uniref:Spore coat assembly protein SafA n=1 Tax=Bacillus methanolicus (strain MGA3 / ATCC 53907) TaxID=796606 RepID=I3ECY0_BACMM|nr:SafA/ExsA family spore coat assembly protein [Bacillus methanolicus]AIE60881.1 spore coat assembly protein SafA [Bacillus methanolicus MGA3]EIJ84351.1 spore coat assembly protein SafA [Bacillus methanolicus MGA3]
MKIHIVQKGDTLWKIAKKYGVNFEELKKINSQLSNPDMIMPGMKIKIPTGGGTVKKEAPMTGGKKEAYIKMGPKKEKPITEHPFAKEKPKPLPVVEEQPQVKPKEAPKPPAPKHEIPKIEKPKPVSPIQEFPKVEKQMPVSPIQEKPKLEKPKPVSPIQEFPKVEKQMPVSPIQEFPKVEKQMPVSPIQEFPKIEKPKTPYSPKMPQPVIPEIVMNNSFTQNMADMSLQQPTPQIPPKPDNIFPGMIKAETSPYMKEEESPLESPTQQGGYQQPMYPYPPNYYPVSPALPGTGYNYPGGFQPQQSPYPYVQGVATMPMHQMPSYTSPAAQMPTQHGMMPEFESMDFDESSPFMHEMPSVQGTMDYQAPLMPQVQGATEYPDMGAQMPHQMPAQMPAHQMPHQMPAQMPAHQMPHQMPAQMPAYQMPAHTMPAYHMPFGPCPPIAVSPVMPGPGFGHCYPYGPVPYGYPSMPQVQGAMDCQMPMPQVQEEMDYQMPMPQVQGAMDNQMPMQQVQGAMDVHEKTAQMPHQAPIQGVKDTSHDCGCGGSGSQGVPYGPMYGPAPGTTPIYTPPHNVQPYGFAQPPYMNYGYGPGQMGSGPYGFPRTEDESSEYEG